MAVAETAWRSTLVGTSVGDLVTGIDTDSTGTAIGDLRRWPTSH